LRIARAEFVMLADGTARRSDSPWASPPHGAEEAGWLAPLWGLSWIERPHHPGQIHCAAHPRFCGKPARLPDFLRIDLVKGYTQFPVHPDDVPKTAITTPSGLFEFPNMTFALRNAGQTFQRFIDGALQGLDFCFAYVDDVLVASSSPEQHREHLKILFERFATYGIIVNVGKSVPGAPSVAFLGFEISADGTRALPDRIAALKDLPQPTTARRYLGILNFYRRHLAHAAEHQAALHGALAGLKGNQLIWTPSFIQAFEATKTALCNVTLLAHPEANAPLGLFCDASQLAVGAALQQLVNGAWQPSAFFSKKLSAAQSSSPFYYRELLAIYLAVQHCRHILEAHTCTIFTDHKPL